MSNCNCKRTCNRYKSAIKHACLQVYVEKVDGLLSGIIHSNHNQRLLKHMYNVYGMDTRFDTNRHIALIYQI